MITLEGPIAFGADAFVCPLEAGACGGEASGAFTSAGGVCGLVLSSGLKFSLQERIHCYLSFFFFFGSFGAEYFKESLESALELRRNRFDNLT